jgi:hypothetical protein
MEISRDEKDILHVMLEWETNAVKEIYHKTSNAYTLQIDNMLLIQILTHECEWLVHHALDERDQDVRKIPKPAPIKGIRLTTDKDPNKTLLSPNGERRMTEGLNHIWEVLTMRCTNLVQCHESLCMSTTVVGERHTLLRAAPCYGAIKRAIGKLQP